MGAVTGTLLGGSLIGGGIGRHEQTEAAEQANALRLREEQDAETNRSVQRTRQLNEVLAQQVAQEGASGFSLSSPSFAAIGEDSFNQYAADENADALNLDFDKMGAAISDQNAQRSEIWGDVGSVFSAAETMYSGGFKTSNPRSAAGNKKAPSPNENGVL